jgi:hypothetical protein
MKNKIVLASIATALILLSCTGKTDDNVQKPSHPAIIGTWQLITGTVIENGDTTVTDYTKNISFLKIINDTHFAFLQHDVKKGKDTVAVFASGGGTYLLKDSLYTEHLAYCSARNWEGNDFSFTISIKNDTLIQSGIEKVETAGVNRINIEKYVRIKK